MKTIISALFTLAFLTNLTFAQEETFLQDGHYEVLDTIQPVSTGDKIEVLELFWYRCPHCNSLEIPLQKWLKNDIPENAEFVAFPAVLAQRWQPAARVFYTLEATGMLDDLHAKVFHAIHSQHKNFGSAESLSTWVDEQGFDGNAVLDAYDSFAVNTKLNYARTMTKKYGINGVPAVIIDGKYRTSPSMAGDHDVLFDVINFLVEKASKDRQS